MNINWYPGHMAKSKRLMANSVRLVDMILEIRDARVPISSANPDFDDLFTHKYRMIILNKSDVADPTITKDWVDWFSMQGIKAIPVNSLDSAEISRLKSDIKKIADKFHRETIEKKGIRKVVRGMVTGIPNVGKSAFINGIAGANKAKTGNKPGVTRINQWIRVDSYLELMDTPGLLWPKLDNREVALNLVFSRTIKEEILDIEEAAHYFLEKAKNEFPEAITARYGKLDMQKKGHEILEGICYKKGWIKSKGAPDFKRGSKHLLGDFQQGRLGRISLESPPEA
ncbi:MAG: ribosome biogenesis GTPase YlqF [Clostridiales bacterium]|nr:ribosome biogenesis GTPase YlqF [Clostridiales bacterium]